ncbi:MAG: gamma-glutamylcyclotransferase [Bacteroidetes bacterium]|nr:MAG: gamma-glutamylcyclotransferase [Bacteroidota bacterium]
MSNVFVYGTLQSPKIVKKLTGKSFQTLPAVLPGYKRYCVKDCDYPAVIQQNDAETTGLVLENVDDLSLEIISFYEGDEYEKRQVTLLTGDSPEIALAFVWAKGFEFLEDAEWDLVRFEETRLKHYIDIVVPETLEEFGSKKTVDY